ncbi:hypothetical protein CYMTET_48649 [Cymbomonas tetramitiformis]|uniref:Reverse transcriptase RNase H-like domain-containing protein n=1 Tax=Cymbomonas tetramitiformis TaxID=36881 RepID=A0AAE0BRT4_9CHLO|nr:hypothetical protein CYMTET_48649 [Cymbomonas tetramitiformis]
MRRLWLLLDLHNIELQARYIRSAANKWANRLLRDPDLDDWKLNHRWFDWAEGAWGSYTVVDRFVSELSAELARRSLGKTEKQYASFQGEMLAVVWAIRTLRQYLHGVHFTLATYHSPLTTLMEKADLQGQHLRWAISLQEFDFTVQYRPGPKNENADVPSRYPRSTTVDETGARLEREGTHVLHAGVGERYVRGFCDSLCLALAEEPPVGEENTPEVQVANCCMLDIRRQLGTGTVHRLFDLHHREELECNRGELFDTDHPEMVRDSGRLKRAAWKALSLVQAVSGTHGEGTPAVYEDQCYRGEAIKKPLKIDTRVLGKGFFREAKQEGVVCYEPCGGLCAGLETLLRNGVKVNKYSYQDIAKDSQVVARASFPCLDLSPAGKLAGLSGKHSSLFYEVVRLLSTLQQLQEQKPAAYVLENVSPLAHRPGTNIRDEVFPYIASVVGQPISFDAARAGSYAHRLRAYWSNMFQNFQFDSVMAKVSRPRDRLVSAVLQAGWQPRPVATGDRAPYYVVNIVGEPLRALPTIMATRASRAFRAPRLGTVVRSKPGANFEEESREVDLVEKSRAMGYSAEELLKADGLSDERLAVSLGLAMDRMAMELLFAVAGSSRRGLPHSVESEQAADLPSRPVDVEDDRVSSGEPAQQSRQAMMAEWVTKSNVYTQRVAQTMSHRDWERRLQTMCSQGQKGRQGLGAPKPEKDTLPRTWQLSYLTKEEYVRKHGEQFVKAGSTPTFSVAVPAWKPPAKDMRLPRLKDTTRLTELEASVAELEADREKHRDVHEERWCMEWLKSKGTVEPPQEEARRVKKRA